LFTRFVDAFIYDAVVLEYLTGHDDKCKLRIVGNWYSMTGYGIAFNKTSKYKEMVNRKILEYAQTGELERSQRFWFSGVCKYKIDETAENKLGPSNFTSAFMLLAVGILLSTILLFLNKVYESCINKAIKKAIMNRADDLENNNNGKSNDMVSFVVFSF
jgi:hypothetical protein